MSTQRAPRLTKQARRNQLLDAAAALLAESGPAGVTMEGVAMRAGVSKALPYAHFDNASAVLVAIHGRELDRLGRKLVAAIDDTDDPDEQMRRVVRAYFDAVADRGPLLGALMGSGSPVRRLVGPSRTGPQFTGALLRRIYGLDRRTSTVMGAIVHGAAMAAVESWGLKEAPRKHLEGALCDFIIAGVRAATVPA